MRRFWLVPGLLLAGLVLLFLAVESLRVPLLVNPAPWLQRGGALAALLGVALLVGDVVLPVPSSLVMIAHGTLFGLLGGALLSLLGGIGATALGFAIGQRGGPLLGRLVPPAERERARLFLARWRAFGVAVSRPVPLLADAVAMLAGASGLSWRRVALAGAAGSLPPALLYAATGAAAAHPQNGVVVFLLVILAAGAFWLAGQWARGWLVRTLGRQQSLSGDCPTGTLFAGRALRLPQASARYRGGGRPGGTAPKAA